MLKEISQSERWTARGLPTQNDSMGNTVRRFIVRLSSMGFDVMLAQQSMSSLCQTKSNPRKVLKRTSMLRRHGDDDLLRPIWIDGQSFSEVGA